MKKQSFGRSCSPLSKPTFPRPLSGPHTPTLSVVYVWCEWRSDQMSDEGFAIIIFLPVRKAMFSLRHMSFIPSFSSSPLVPIFSVVAEGLQMDPKGHMTDQYVCVCFHYVFCGDLRQRSVNFTLRKSVFLSHTFTDICFPFSIFVFHPQWECVPEDTEPFMRSTVHGEARDADSSFSEVSDE